MKLAGRAYGSSRIKSLPCTCSRSNRLAVRAECKGIPGNRLLLTRQRVPSFWSHGSRKRCHRRSFVTLNQSSPPTLERQRLQNEQARWHFDYRNGLESLANEDIGDPSTSFSDAQSLRKQDSAHALEAVFQNGASSSLHPFRSSQVANLDVSDSWETARGAHDQASQESEHCKASGSGKTRDSWSSEEVHNWKAEGGLTQLPKEEEGGLRSQHHRNGSGGADSPLLEPGGRSSGTSTLQVLQRLDRKALQKVSTSELDGEQKEQLRRARISAANQGKPSWNSGQKHSEATKALISVRTKEALQRPDVVIKLKNIARVKRHTEEAKEKIKQWSRQYHTNAKAARELRIPTLGNCLKSGRYSLEDLGDRATECIADLLPPPQGEATAAEQRASANDLLQHFSVENVLSLKNLLWGRSSRKQAKGSRSKPRLKPTMTEHGPWVTASLPQPKSRVPARRKPQHRGEDHRAAIAEAIKKKWEDPEYRARILKGKAEHSKSSGKPKRVRNPSSAGQKTARKTGANTQPKKVPNIKKKVGRPAKKEPQLQPTLQSEELLAMESSFQEQSRARQAKLQNARKLVAQMEDTLQHFADTDIVEESPEVEQSVSEAYELLARAKEQVSKLEAEDLQEQQFAELSSPSMPDLTFGPLSGGGSGQVQEASTEQIEEAMLTLNLD